jgi:hypothetical protein
MGFKLKDTMTAKRREWLETLCAGPAQRKDKVGYDCMQLGWTEWVPDVDGRPGTKERITDAGREALERFNAEFDIMAARYLFNIPDFLRQTPSAIVRHRHPRATAHHWADRWTIYTNEITQTVLGEGKTALLAWQAAARNVMSNGAELRGTPEGCGIAGGDDAS